MLASGYTTAQAATLTISNVKVTASDTTATITWDTNLPADSKVATLFFISRTNFYDPSLTTHHTIQAINLSASTTYEYAITSVAADGTSAFRDYTSFTTTGGGSSGSSTPLPSRPANPNLINNNGTYYLIMNGQRRGITNPGMLKTYGYALSDATVATAQTLALPVGQPLLPSDGALVRTAQDPTVYLISGQQRHGFTSPQVFLAQGYKWSSILTVTAPELNQQPIGSIISEGADAHLPGADINRSGTIYFVGTDSQLHPYPNSLAYNSWHLQDDYSTVVTANEADLSKPIGIPVNLRE